jgi:hypothetical protein
VSLPVSQTAPRPLGSRMTSKRDPKLAPIDIFAPLLCCTRSPPALTIRLVCWVTGGWRHENGDALHLLHSQQRSNANMRIISCVKSDHSIMKITIKLKIHRYNNCCLITWSIWSWSSVYS